MVKMRGGLKEGSGGLIDRILIDSTSRGSVAYVLRVLDMLTKVLSLQMSKSLSEV